MKRSQRLLLCVSMASLMLLGACGSEPEPEVAAAPAPAPAPVKPVAAAVGDETASFAKAVGDGKPGAAVTIRYDFGGKPTVGVPTDLDLAFIPNAGVDSLDATLSGMDGITLAGSLTPSFSAVESGKPYRHKVSVLADRNGVFYITVSVNTQIAGSSLNRTFAIPFVVGQAVAQSKPAPARDAKGEAIRPMKAVESSEPPKKP